MLPMKNRTRSRRKGGPPPSMVSMPRGINAFADDNSTFSRLKGGEQVNCSKRSHRVTAADKMPPIRNVGHDRKATSKAVLHTRDDDSTTSSIHNKEIATKRLISQSRGRNASSPLQQKKNRARTPSGREKNRAQSSLRREKNRARSPSELHSRNNRGATSQVLSTERATEQGISASRGRNASSPSRRKKNIARSPSLTRRRTTPAAQKGDVEMPSIRSDPIPRNKNKNRRPGKRGVAHSPLSTKSDPTIRNTNGNLHSAQRDVEMLMASHKLPVYLDPDYDDEMEIFEEPLLKHVKLDDDLNERSQLYGDLTRKIQGRTLRGFDAFLDGEFDYAYRQYSIANDLKWGCYYGEEHERAVDSIIRMSIILEAQGNMKSATSQKTEALGLYRALNVDKIKVIDALLSVGNSYFFQEKYKDALAFYNEALKNIKKHLPAAADSVANVKTKIGRTYTKLGRDTDAIKNFEDVIKLQQYSVNSSETDITNTQVELGDVHSPNKGERMASIESYINSRIKGERGASIESYDETRGLYSDYGPGYDDPSEELDSILDDAFTCNSQPIQLDKNLTKEEVSGSASANSDSQTQKSALTGDSDCAKSNGVEYTFDLHCCMFGNT